MLFRIFDIYLKSYKVNYYDIRLVFDNFKIINLLIKDKFYVENKIYYYKIKENVEIEFLSL